MWPLVNINDISSYNLVTWSDVVMCVAAGRRHERWAKRLDGRSDPIFL